MTPDDISALVTLLLAHRWWGCAALVIGLLVRLMKSDVPWLPINVPARWRPLVALGLGIVSGILEKLAAGTELSQALVGGIISGALPIAGHAAIVDALRGGLDLFAKRDGVPPADGSGPPTPRSPRSDPPDASLRRTALAWGTQRLALLSRWMALPVAATVVLVVGCTPQQAHVAVDVVDAACVALVRVAAPGLEFVCGLTAEQIDILIDREMKAARAGATPSPMMVALQAAKKAKAGR